jgi:hypothetical protein
MINILVLVPEITKGMKSIGSKSLIKLKHSKSVIEHQIEKLQSISNQVSICIATGFDHDRINKTIEKYKHIKTIHNPQYEETNYGKSLSLYLTQHPKVNNLLIIGSGVLFKHNVFSKELLKQNSKLLVLDKPSPNFTIGCNRNTRLEYLFYDLPETWTECAYLNDAAIGTIKTLMLNKTIDQMYVFEIINELLRLGVSFDKHTCSKNSFYKILGTKDVNKAKLFI